MQNVWKEIFAGDPEWLARRNPQVCRTPRSMPYRWRRIWPKKRYTYLAAPLGAIFAALRPSFVCKQM
jgi:hypothetical protein